MSQKIARREPIGDVQARLLDAPDGDAPTDGAVEPGPHARTSTDFDEIFETSSYFVWCVLAKLGIPGAEVPDVCQDVFLVVHRRLPDFDRSMSLRSWIYGICVRTASDHRRRRRRRMEQSVFPVPEQAVAPRQHDALEHARDREWLQAALDELDEDKRAVFVLYELEELTMSEVAAAVGCPLQTAYSRLYTSRDAVKKAFRRFKAQRSGK